MAYEIKGSVNVQGDITIRDKNIITSVNNKPIDSTGDVSISTSDLGITGTKGDSLFFTDTGFINDKTTKFARIVDSATELSAEQADIQSFGDIFDQWDRFSHDETGVQPAIPDELNAWQYVSGTDSVLSTINSVSYIGFVSPEKYTKYDLEVNLSSTNTDDDWITLVLAYIEIDGVQHTISAVRRIKYQVWPGTIDRGDWRWGIVYNFNQGTSGGEYMIQNGSSLVSANTTAGGWDQFPGGINISASRDGDSITASTSEYGTPGTYIANLTIDLNSDPRLAKFKNPSSIGYGALSQIGSSYKNLKFSGSQNIIFDSRNGNVYYYNSTSWVIDPDNTINTLLSPGTLYTNTNTNKLYFYNGSTATFISGVNIGFSTGYSPDMTGFTYLNSANGYQKLPSGLIFQWITVTGTNDTATVALPIPFPNNFIHGWTIPLGTFSATLAPFYAVSAASTASAITVNARYVSTNSVSTTGTINCKVFVIGY